MSQRFAIRQGRGAEQSSSDLSRLLVEWLETSGPDGLFRSCATCKYMRKEGPAHCEQFGATPPVAVIVAGCEQYLDETDIPY